jgi:hypothetical protein
LYLYFPIRQLLDPTFYKQVLRDNYVYQSLPASIAKQLATNFSEDRCIHNPLNNDCPLGGNPAFTNPNIQLLLLDQEAWKTILSSLIDPAWLQVQTENLIDQVFFILLDSPDPANTNLKISLQEVKHRLAGPQGTQAFLEIIESQNPCDFDQLLGLAQLGLGLPADIETLLCRPPAYIIESLTPTITTLIAGMVDLVPDYLTFSLPIDRISNPSAGEALDPQQPDIPQFIAYLRWAQTVIALSPLIPLFLITLVTIFAVRSVKDLLLWWGSTFLAAGLISLLLVFFSYLTLDWSAAQLIPGTYADSLEFSSIVVGLDLTELFIDFGERLIITVLIPSIVVTSLGLLGLAGFFLLNRRTTGRGEEQVTMPESSAGGIEPG